VYSITPLSPIVISGFALVTAAASSVALTYIVRQRARWAGLFDHTDARKLHRSEIPRVGGVAIVSSVFITLCILAIVSGPGILTSGGSGMIVVLGGALAISVLGLYDDLWQVRARWKFLTQIVIALVVYALGVRVTTLTFPFAGVLNLGPFAGLIFTVLWLVGITNAFNLIDGLDGLASGAALFALTTMFVVATANGRFDAGLVTLVLAGATLGFLYFNFSPATIFLGDSGSLFLGFMLAGLGLISAQKSPTVVAVAIPVVSLGLPVLDTSLAVLRRFLRRQPIFAADRGHIHHRLLGRGYSPRTVVLTLYAACAVLALCGMLLVNDGGWVAFVLAVVGAGVFFTVHRLRFFEFEEAMRLLRLGARQRTTIARGVRVREASARLAELHDLAAVFDALAQTFAEDGCPRAEVRLRPDFAGGNGMSPVNGDLGRRAEDDIPVWAWSRDDLPGSAPSAAWWHVSLPLLDPRGDRVGSMLLWQDGRLDGDALPHFHTIAGELREQVESKVLALWHLQSGMPLPAAAVAANGSSSPSTPLPLNRRSGELRDRVHSGSGPRVA
jgi:UDP-GlcNAc:undecaprenyl-phosphate/decaprenyl-phosphate GlcNAc-1-phosphate transferase